MLNRNFTPKEIILLHLQKKIAPRPEIGNPVSSTTIEQMELTNSFFPNAHHNSVKMFELSRASYEILGFDMIMPIFSVVIESYALGCKVNWGKQDQMPYIVGKLWKNYKDIKITKDFLSNHKVTTVLECIYKLKNRYPDIAIVGKAFGPWSLGYHLFGVSDFLIKTIENPVEVKDILNKLSEVTISFANAQVNAGADIITVPDHAAQDLCSPLAYKEFLIPVHLRLTREIKAPVIV